MTEFERIVSTAVHVYSQMPVKVELLVINVTELLEITATMQSEKCIHCGTLQKFVGQNFCDNCGENVDKEGEMIEMSAFFDY